MAWVLLGLGFALIAFAPLFPAWPLVALAGFGLVAIAASVRGER